MLKYKDLKSKKKILTMFSSINIIEVNYKIVGKNDFISQSPNE